VRELKLKVGDEVSEGALVALIEASEAAAAAPDAKPAAAPAAAPPKTEPDVTVRDSASVPAPSAAQAAAAGKPAETKD
jgi:pyruvate/2-oxoglutarate dehydrogenase complex dihydrolipoamide acyltransferase (E2) component